MMTAGNLLGWYVAGRAAFLANEALVEVIEAVMEDTTIPAQIERYYLCISTFTVNLSDGTFYSSYMAPLYEGNKEKVKHSRPILNLNRNQTRRIRRAAEIRANREVVLKLKSDLGLA